MPTPRARSVWWYDLGLLKEEMDDRILLCCAH